MIRRRRQWGTLLIMLVGTALPLRQAVGRPLPWLSEAATVRGTVQHISGSRLVLATGADQPGTPSPSPQLTFELTVRTQVLEGTQPLAVADLQAGDVLLVHYYHQAGTRIAHTISALLTQAQALSPLELSEGRAETDYQQATHLMEASHVSSALPFLDRAILLRPDFLEAYGRRGYAYATLGMLEDDQAVRQRYRERAIADYSTVIDRARQRGLVGAVWYNNRGVLYRQLEDTSHALQDFTMALQIEPTYLSALQNRASVRRAIGDWEGALQDLTQVIGLEPQTGKWYCQRGQVWLRQEATTQAHQDFERCLALDPALGERYREAIDQLHGGPQG